MGKGDRSCFEVFPDLFKKYAELQLLVCSDETASSLFIKIDIYMTWIIWLYLWRTISIQGKHGKSNHMLIYKRVILNRMLNKSFLFAHFNFQIIIMYLEMNPILNISRIFIRSAWFNYLFIKNYAGMMYI